MANPTDHGPDHPDPAGRRPDPDPHAPPPRPDDSESDFALPDLADLKDFGLSDPGRLSGVNLASGSAAGSEDDWLPPLPDEQLPGSNAEFDLPALGQSDDSLSGEGPSPVAPALHVEPAFESEEAPLGEVLPALEPESPEEAAAADSAEADLFAPVAPGTGWFDRGEDDHPSSDDLPIADEADLGDPVPASSDSSNILSGLSEPAPGPGHSSDVRLEAPGVDATLADEPMAGLASGRPGPNPDPTDDESPLPPEFHHSPGRVPKAPTEPQFDLTPGTPADDIFSAPSDESSLTGATSSIFTGLPASPGRADPADLADLDDVSEAVEFSDHPDRRSSDSDSLHVPDELRAAAEDAAPAAGLLAGAAAAGKPRRPASDPSVELDWVDEGQRPAPAAAGKPTREPRDRDPVRRPPPPGPVNKGAVGGMFLGLLLGGGAVAGLNYSGVWNPGKTDPVKAGAGKQQVAANNNPPANGGQPQAQPPAAAPVSPKAVLAAGDPAGAVRAFEKAGAATPADKAVLGEARVFAWLREPAGADALKQARADLEAAVADPAAADSPAAARAALYLGLTHELAGDRAKAKEVYEDGRKRFAGSAAVFDAALERLRATDPDADKSSRLLPGGTGLPAGDEPTRAEQLAVLAALLLVADEVPAPAAEEPAEAGPLFWKAVNAANAGKYDDAVKLIGEAKAAHQKRAKALAGRGLNPLSDPLEQIFPRSCDDLKAYWEVRKAIYDHPTAGGLARKDGVAKALDQLATAEKRATDAVQAATELRATNEKLAADLKAAGEKVTTAEKEAKAAGEKLAAAEKEARAARDTAQKQRDAAEAATATARKELDQRAADLKAAQAEQRKAADALEGVAKVLRDAKLLDDKADPAAVLAAARLAATKAAGGSDAAAAAMKDLSARAAKAEEAVKAAAADREKLEAGYKAEVKKLRDAETALKEKQAADLKKLKDDQQAAVMQLQKDHAAEVKKMTGGVGEKEQAVRDEMDKKIAKLQEGQKAQIKELQEGFAATEKKLRDAAAAADKKLRDGLEEERKKLFDKYTAEVKKLTADVEAAQKKAADAEATAKKVADDAKEATKKIADAEALAKKAAESEAATKKGAESLAVRVKDAVKEAADARDRATAERDRATAAARALEAERVRAEELAAKLRADLKAEKDRAAELAKMLAAAPTPGAGGPAGGPVSRDVAASAARSLDQGITAYKAGRYEEAERSLATATTANPADAVGWYFLGAARWTLGKRDDAREAFRRGAGAESARVVPVRVIDAAVGPIQGPARDALAAERP